PGGVGARAGRRPPPPPRARHTRAEPPPPPLCRRSDRVGGGGRGGRANPPIRTRHDVDALWGAVADGTIQWIASDHACCLEELKQDDLWPAQPGFGGTALLYPVLISEGYHKRGLSMERIAQLVS